MSPGLVLGLDQGTSSTRCLALDRELVQRGAAAVPVRVSHPGVGLVEQDPEELAASAQAALDGALAAANASERDVAAVGIAAQTETFLLAERASGRPIHPAIVWQDRRTAERCAALERAGHGALVRERTGLELDPTFPATKIGWVLDHVDQARAAALRGELVYHDVAGWLVRRLAGGSVERIDVCNAGRTLVCRLGGVEWDQELLEIFELPGALLPPVVACDEVAARGRGGMPLAATLGDQPASLLGLRGWESGSAKVTLGTGAFVLVQAGPTPPRPPGGVLASCTWQTRRETSFALEGFVPSAGAALDWCAQVGLLPPASELDTLLTDAQSAGADALAFVPALQGLGTPSWEPRARGALLGLSRASTREQLARAAIDGVLHQVVDAIDAIGAAVPVQSVLLDGGMSRSEWVVQRLADLANVRVGRAADPQATAIGAAMLAGLATGFWSDRDEFPPLEVDRVAEPSLAGIARAGERERWAEAVALARSWSEHERDHPRVQPT